MLKQAEEVTVNKDGVYDRNPEMLDNKDDYPKYPRRKDWEKKLITLKRKLNFDRKSNALEIPRLEPGRSGFGEDLDREKGFIES